MSAQTVSRTTVDRVERVQSILRKRSLTLSRVSQESETLYGPSSPYFVPHNFYYDLRLETFSPSIYQMFALSRISGYRLAHWLLVFGFDLQIIPQLQVLLPCNRTILLDSSLDDPEDWVPWFGNKPGISASSIAPLGQLLVLAPARRLHELCGINHRRFLYAKIGQQDALFASPDLLAGSIVRVNPGLPRDLAPAVFGRPISSIFLIEHGTALYCSRARVAADGRIVLINPQMSQEAVELQLSREARVRGTVDMEIRSMLAAGPPALTTRGMLPPRLEPFVSDARLSHLLRRARRRIALSFRDASAMSRRIAGLLGDEHYFISPSSLSDYEACDIAPRHFHKVITLCLLYGVHLSTFLRSVGIVFEAAGQEPIPDPLLPRVVLTGPVDSQAEAVDQPGFLGHLAGQFQEVPFFLRGSLGPLSGMSAVSLHDFFWVGGQSHELHPYLSQALLVVVNRRKKKLRSHAGRPAWLQPLYVMMLRDGTYRLGQCGVKNGSLVLQALSPTQPPGKALYPADVEVVGQVVTVVRKLP